MEERGIHLFLECYREARRTRYLSADRRLSNQCPNIACIDRAVRHQVDVRLDLSAIKRQYLQRHPQMRCSHCNQDWRSITLNLMTCPGGSCVELRCHENGTTFCVHEQVATGFTVHRKAIPASPVKYCLPTASQHSNIERFDLHLL